jgi:flagellar hook-associated protein 1 FlgK
MPISSFYGLQTSLRGLLAQQRSLDTTATTSPTPRRRATRARRRSCTPRPRPTSRRACSRTAVGAQLGAGVDVQAYRRIRDTFLDLQYRGQFTRSPSSRRAPTPPARRARPGEPATRHQHALGEYWNAWSDLADSPDEQAAQSALLQKSASLADAFAAAQPAGGAQSDAASSTPTSPRRPVRRPPRARSSRRARDREPQRHDQEVRDRRRRPERPHGQRDLLLDKLSGYGQISVTDNARRLVDVPSAAPPTPRSSAATGQLAGSRSPRHAPGGRLGAC